MDLNESKTSVISSAEAVKEETALDRRFESARDEVYGELLDSIAASGYGSSILGKRQLMMLKFKMWRNLRLLTTFGMKDPIHP